MWALIAKTLVSAVLIVAIAEMGKRSSFWGAALAALPLTSLLAFVWMHADGVDNARIAEMAQSIFWLVLPSLVLFLLLPWLLRHGWNFWLSLLLGGMATAAAYGALLWLWPRLGFSAQ